MRVAVHRRLSARAVPALACCPSLSANLLLAGGPWCLRSAVETPHCFSPPAAVLLQQPEDFGLFSEDGQHKMDEVSTEVLEAMWVLCRVARAHGSVPAVVVCCAWARVDKAHSAHLLASN